MRSLPLITTLLLALFAAIAPAAAQDPTPRIGPFAIDLHASIPRFPSDNQQLADSRGLLLQELPGRGLGLHAGAQVYFLKWKAVTFGVGADLTVAQAHQDPPQITADFFGRAVTERFTHVAPELSFNFGDGDGWSYLSGGIGPSTWSVVPDGVDINGEALNAPPLTVTMSPTGLLTAVDPPVCTWENLEPDPTKDPAWALSGSYKVTASFGSVTSQPVFVAVASAAAPPPGCGPTS